MSILEKNNQEILVGSTKLNFNNQEKFDKAKYMLKYMKFNKAYTHSISKTELNNSEKEKILKDYKNRYQEYRNNWLNALDVKNKKKPLSIDIEIAAICDLACPHCSREFLVTPDKLINFDLYKSIIDQAAAMVIVEDWIRAQSTEF